MTKYEILYEEYKGNPLLYENYTFDEVLELYDEWKQSLSMSFDAYVKNLISKK